MMLPASATVFTVSQLNLSVRTLLETEIGDIWLRAEIADFSQPSSGHWYFTLKDGSAQVRCAMFRNCNRRVTFRPKNGLQVVIRATVTVYEPRGDYQLIAANMQPAGEGGLQQQFEQLKQRLAAEGLFDLKYKQRLPQPANQVGVITSATGAALQDILRILERRDPSLPVVIYPTMVQGTEAPAAIVRALDIANQRNECDILIIGRGGGSLEDLQSFNDERVARAVFASRIPVISAVGHESDITITDFVADLRAPTPSAAAELVSRDQNERLRQLQSQQQRTAMALDYYLAQRQRCFTALHHRLQQQHPELRLARQQTSLLRLKQRLNNAMQNALRRAASLEDRCRQRLSAQQPLHHLQRVQQQVRQWQWRLQQCMFQHFSRNKQQVATLTARLEAVSPLATLARGFSVTTDSKGEMIKDIARLHSGDRLHTRFQGGWVESEIIKVGALKIPRN